MSSGRRAKTAGNEFLDIYIALCRQLLLYRAQDDLGKRVAEHQAGEIEGYTATRLPVTLVFAEEFPTREEALASERQIKGWSRKKKEAMMRGGCAEVSRLARRKRTLKSVP